jgi:hypothetical protein
MLWLGIPAAALYLFNHLSRSLFSMRLQCFLLITMMTSFAAELTEVIIGQFHSFATARMLLTTVEREDAFAADQFGDEVMTVGGSRWYGPENTREEVVQWKWADFLAAYLDFRCAYEVRS